MSPEIISWREVIRRKYRKDAEICRARAAETGADAENNMIPYYQADNTFCVSTESPEKALETDPEKNSPGDSSPFPGNGMTVVCQVLPDA